MINFDNYYMLVALAVREKANCLGRKVGAIIVKDNRIIGTGYNGTPEKMTNCEDDGCSRCRMKHKDNETFTEKLYDKCICVHAEQNAMITAARFGHGIEGATVYTTYQPCFSCSKEFLQAKIKTFYYLEKINISITGSGTKNKRSAEEISKDQEFEKQYGLLMKSFSSPPLQLSKEELKKCIDNMRTNFKKLKS